MSPLLNRPEIDLLFTGHHQGLLDALPIMVGMEIGQPLDYGLRGR